MSTPQGPYQLALRPAAPASAGAAAPSGAAAQDPEAAPASDSSRLADRLRRVPQVADRGNGRYEFGERDADGIMQIEVLPAQVQVLIPRPWVMSRGPQVFALVFMMAEWLGWEVHDLQIGSVLKKDVVLQGLVAMRQAQLLARGVHVPKPVWNAPPDVPRPPGMGRGNDGGGRGPQET